MMKRIVLGTAAALIAIVPVLASADCGPDHATMASSSADKKPALAQAGKTPAAATTKVTTKQAKSSAAKKTTASTSNQEMTTVVARTN
jgi:hypothetical protein